MESVEASGKAAPLVELGNIVAKTRQVWADAPIASVDIRHPHDAHARITVRGDIATGPLRSAPTLVFDGVSGELIAQQPARTSGSKTFRDVSLGLHEGLFAGPALRVLYVFSGLLGAAMLATGLILWSVKRRQRIEKAKQAPYFGLRLVEKLNVATVIGLPVAVAAYFWANRLLPVDMTHRAEWEMHSLFLVWLVLLGHAALRPTAQVWKEQSWLAAGAFGLLPILNALTTNRHLGASLPAGDWIFAGFDLAMLALGLAFALLARYLTSRVKPAESPLPESPAFTSRQTAGATE